MEDSEKAGNIFQILYIVFFEFFLFFLNKNILLPKDVLVIALLLGASYLADRSIWKPLTMAIAYHFFSLSYLTDSNRAEAMEGL